MGANDSYHKYKQDIAMMSSMGVKHYRFSISWPRMVPTGVVSDGINPKAVKFYHDVIEELLDHAIEPIITMYHWDLPQGLLDFDWNSVCKSAPCPVSSLLGVKGATGNVANDSYHKYKRLSWNPLS